MKLKQIVNVKNIFLWVSGIAAIVFAIYLLTASWTVTLNVVNTATQEAETASFKISALSVVLGQDIQLGLGNIYEGGGTINLEGLINATLSAHPNIFAGPGFGILYLIGCILFIVAGLGSIGVSFLTKKSKLRGWLYVLCIIIGIAGMIVWYIGENRAAVLFASSTDGNNYRFTYAAELFEGIERAVTNNTLIGNYHVTVNDITPVKYFMNRSFFWINAFIAAATFILGMIIKNPEVEVETKE